MIQKNQGTNAYQSMNNDGILYIIFQPHPSKIQPRNPIAFQLKTTLDSHRLITISQNIPPTLLPDLEAAHSRTEEVL